MFKDKGPDRNKYGNPLTTVRINNKMQEVRIILPDQRCLCIDFFESDGKLVAGDVYTTSPFGEVKDMQVVCLTEGGTNYRSSDKDEKATKVVSIVLNKEA